MSKQYFDIEDAKYYEMTDPGDECGSGGPPAYGPGIDIGCVKRLTLRENRIELQQTGDAGVCAKVDRTKDYSGRLLHGGLSAELLAKLIGAERTSHVSGGGVNLSRLAVNQTDLRGRGAIIAKLDTPELSGCMHLILWNARIASKPDVEAGEDAFYNTELVLSLERSRYAAHGCKGWYDLLEFDALVELPAAFPGTDDYPA